MARISWRGRFTSVSADALVGALFALTMIVGWSRAGAAESEAAARTLSGSIVDQAGHGVAGARVSLVRLHMNVADFSKTVRVRARYEESATGEPLTITEGGEVTVKVVSNTFGRLRGKVVGAGGQPMAGVKLTLMEWVGESGRGAEAVISGKDGSYEIRHVWPGATVTVQAEAVGWTRASTARREIKIGETAELPPLVLEPATLPLAGRVVDDSGAPLAGLPISFQAERSANQETVSDRLGRFRFEGLAEETVSLFVGSYGGPTGSAKAAAGQIEVEIVATRPRPAESAAPAEDK